VQFAPAVATDGDERGIGLAGQAMCPDPPENGVDERRTAGYELRDGLTGIETPFEDVLPGSQGLAERSQRLLSCRQCDVQVVDG
jgi:hypothetical protein